MGFSKSSAKGKVHSNTSLPQKQEKNQINHLTQHLKQLEKEEMKNPRDNRRKKNLIRAEMNAKETKETIAKIKKTKSWFFERINKIDRPLARLIKKEKEKNRPALCGQGLGRHPGPASHPYHWGPGQHTKGQPGAPSGQAWGSAP